MVLFKQLRVRFVSFNVASNLRFPILVVRYGYETVTHWTAVPKAPINKNGYLLIWESDVGVSLYVFTVKPPPMKARASKESAQAPFRRSLFAFNGLHRPSSVFGGEIIWHGIQRKRIRSR